MGDWHFTKQEEDIIARSLGLALQDGDLLSLDEEKIAESLLNELNTGSAE